MGVPRCPHDVRDPCHSKKKQGRLQTGSACCQILVWDLKVSKNSKLETGLAGSSEGIYQVPDKHNHTHFIKIIMKLIKIEKYWPLFYLE